MKKIFILILLISILIPTTIMAADEYTLLEPLPCIEGTGNNCTGSTTTATMNLETYIGYIFKFAIAISAFLAVIMIIYGGFEIMLSEAVSTKLDGKGRIQNAIYGLLMVLASYLILRTIDPRLVEINTNITPLRVDTTEVKNYNAQLNNDINNAIMLNSVTANRQLAEIQKLREYNEKIDAALGSDTLTADERDFFNTEKAKTLEAMSKIQSEENKVVTQSSGLMHLRNAFSIINNPNPTSEDRDNLANNYLNSNIRDTVVYTEYQTSIAEAKKRGDTAEVQLLQKQMTFVRDEMLREADLKKTINDRVETRLEQSLQTYQAELANPTKIVGTGVDKSTYETILNSRIERLNAALNKK